MKIKIRLAANVWGTVGGCKLSERSSCRYDANRTLLLFYLKGDRLKETGQKVLNHYSEFVSTSQRSG